MKGHTQPKLSLHQRQDMAGWCFLTSALILIVLMSFIPIIQARILSFHTGVGAKLRFSGLYNYIRMFQDKVFLQSLANTFIYLIIQVPIMLIVVLVLASMLNNKNLRCKGLFRTAIFLPCATSLVSYAIIFRGLFATDGFVNYVLIKLGVIETGVLSPMRSYYRILSP